MHLNKKVTALVSASLAAATTGVLIPQAFAQAPPAPPRMTRPHPGRQEAHPELRKAGRALMNARRFLQVANRDFGGHRAKATQLIDEALEQLREAAQADKH